MKSQETAKKFKIDTCIFNADWSKEQQRYGKNYATNINANTKQVVIPHSSHPFTEDGVAEKLYTETAEYFKSLQPK